MGMFDYYKPAEKLVCLKCNKEPKEWQGKDGPCELLLWEEGKAAPVRQIVDEDPMEKDEIEQYRLPSPFYIYGYGCECADSTVAICRCPAGVWNKTEVVR